MNNADLDLEIEIVVHEIMESGSGDSSIEKLENRIRSRLHEFALKILNQENDLHVPLDQEDRLIWAPVGGPSRQEFNELADLVKRLAGAGKDQARLMAEGPTPAKLDALRDAVAHLGLSVLLTEGQPAWIDQRTAFDQALERLRKLNET